MTNNSLVNSLKTSITSQNAVVGVIGLGYVGLPLLMLISKKGFKTYGFDVDQTKIKYLKNKKSYISHISDDLIKSITNFTPTSDYKYLSKCDIIIICVPTPTTETNEPDLSYIINTGKAILSNIKVNQLIVLESTTYPTTTRDVLKPILESNGLKCGKDFFLAFSPEREDPGNKDFNTENITKIVGGIEKISSDLASTFYSSVINKVFTVSSTEIAETTKMLENTFRAVNIALVNELKILLDRMGIDIWEVIEASKTKPFGFMPFYPGPGWGGHCIPVDPFYLSYIAKKYDYTTKFIELAGQINIRMPEFIVEKTVDALNKRKTLINGAKILILGVAYKKDIGDQRESPAFKIIELLENKGAKVDYNDPYVPVIPKMRKFKMNKSSICLSPKTIKKYNCLILVTNHSCYDYKMISKSAKLIIDTRNTFKEHSSNIIKA
ncbi:MAG: UDP-N-acetyl-D-glucosamine dehydrogenase [Elusimicrobia bacterium RIFOXYA2_FULL_39_19]|nr:MAG: UDP-N-acetyl-D-glucosamine dehydrogenase [Elusimicrobia bacterium RIFOXYA2_FULL_39_19]